MSWFNRSTERKESHVERIARLYPIGSRWRYLGRPCTVSQHFDYEGCLDFRVHYLDDSGVIRECCAAPAGLEPSGGEGA